MTRHDGRLVHGSRSSLLPTLLAGLTLAGCCSPGDSECDPMGWFNRPVLGFNDVLDDYLIWPITYVYTKATPAPLQHGVSNFFDNIKYPNVVLNDFLQGKVGQGFGDIGRFLVNTTIGVGGLIDVAKPMGLERHQEDLGQTFGAWGIGEGVYLVLPLLGPTTLRDAPGLALARVTSLLIFVDDTRITIPATVLDAVDERARASTALEHVEETAVDRYVYIREAYRQHRLFLIYDGHPPLPEIDPDLLDMEDEDEGEPPEAAPKKTEPPAVRQAEKHRAKHSGKNSGKPDRSRGAKK